MDDDSLYVLVREYIYSKTTAKTNEIRKEIKDKTFNIVKTQVEQLEWDIDKYLKIFNE